MYLGIKDTTSATYSQTVQKTLPTHNHTHVHTHVRRHTLIYTYTYIWVKDWQELFAILLQIFYKSLKLFQNKGSNNKKETSFARYIVSSQEPFMFDGLFTWEIRINRHRTIRYST